MAATCAIGAHAQTKISGVSAAEPSQTNSIDNASAVAERKTVNNELTPAVSPTPATTPQPSALTERERTLLERIESLEKRLAEVETRTANKTGATIITASAATGGDSVQPSAISSQSNETAKSAAPQQVTETDRGVLDYFRDTTLNFNIDGYIQTNFNRPYNRLNQLRAYDQSSNSFSLNQANVVIENAPNLEQNRRFGFRLDLQYGQATEVAQGNPANELRPEAFRPLWQAYGTYVAPVGKRDVTIDVGKWAGSLGYETNYTKDNFNYSRAYFFNFLPFYHFGVRASVPVTKKLTATYWLVNGANQSEDFNSSKSQAILLTYKPTDKVVLQGNYYVGREQRDQTLADEFTPANFDITRGRITPKGRFHVLDAYATFLLTDKLTFALEGDYVINRVNRRDAPTRVTGGVAYLRYQFTPKFALAGRGEYLSDRGGLFSGVTQALKETTATAEYKFADGFLLRGEYRRDWSNQPYFLTNDLNILKKEQNTATLGFVWWFGRKQGAW